MKILIVQIGRIGDMVLTTPMFRSIKEYMPNASVQVLSSKRASQVIINNPHLDKIHIYLKGISLLGLVHKLRKERFEIWIDPKDHYSFESTILATLSNAKLKIGYNRIGKKVFDVSIRSYEQNTTLHVVERNLLPLAHLGITQNKNILPEIFIHESIINKVASTIHTVKEKLSVINISAGHPSRKWEITKWVEVIRYLEYQRYLVLVIFDPRDIKEAENISTLHPSVKLIYSPSIDYINAIISMANIVVTPDTAIVHIASAFNIPIIVLYPNVKWNINKFRPLSKENEIVISDEGINVCDISAQSVIDAITRILKKI